MAKKKTTAHHPNIPQATLERARRQAGISTSFDEPKRPAPAKTSHKHSPSARTPQPVIDEQAMTARLAEEYAYVVSDLRSMGILAAGLFATLIILAIIL